MAEVIGLILAGGRGRRLGGMDKGWYIHQGEPLVKHALKQIGACRRIIISANRNLAEYRALGYTVVEDRRPYYQGPLSGIESAMLYAPDAYFYVMPCDLLGVPKNWLDRLKQQVERLKSPWVGTQSANGLQPLLGLWSAELLPELTRFLDNDKRRVMAFIQPYRNSVLELPGNARLLNLNSLLSNGHVAGDFLHPGQ